MQKQCHHAMTKHSTVLSTTTSQKTWELKRTHAKPHGNSFATMTGEAKPQISYEKSMVHLPTFVSKLKQHQRSTVNPSASPACLMKGGLTILFVCPCAFCLGSPSWRRLWGALLLRLKKPPPTHPPSTNLYLWRQLVFMKDKHHNHQDHPISASSRAQFPPCPLWRCCACCCWLWAVGLLLLLWLLLLLLLQLLWLLLLLLLLLLLMVLLAKFCFWRWVYKMVRVSAHNLPAGVGIGVVLVR